MSLLTNLSSYWKLDEASGNGTDTHGSRTWTDVNTVGAGTGKINGDRVFVRGNTEYFTTATSPITALPLSANFWFKFTTSGLNQNLFNGGISGSNNFAWGLFISTTDKLGFFASDGSANFDFINGTTTLSTGTWYMATLVWRSSTDRELYLNTASEGTSSVNRTVSGSSDLLTFGSYVGSLGSDTFGGEADEMGLWTRSLDSTDISNLYNSGNALDYSNFGGGGGTNARLLEGLLNGGMLIGGRLVR